MSSEESGAPWFKSAVLKANPSPPSGDPGLKNDPSRLLSARRLHGFGEAGFKYWVGRNIIEVEGLSAFFST